RAPPTPLGHPAPTHPDKPYQAQIHAPWRGWEGRAAPPTPATPHPHPASQPPDPRVPPAQAPTPPTAGPHSAGAHARHRRPPPPPLPTTIKLRTHKISASRLLRSRIHIGWYTTGREPTHGTRTPRTRSLSAPRPHPEGAPPRTAYPQPWEPSPVHPPGRHTLVPAPHARGGMPSCECALRRRKRWTSPGPGPLFLTPLSEEQRARVFLTLGQTA